MKKYNLSTIMKRAWELVRKDNMTMSTALKKAWAEAKGGNMTRKEEIEAAIKKYDIRPSENGTIGIFNTRAIANGVIPENIKAMKPEFLQYFEEKRTAYEARQAKISAIEGLEEIEACRNAWSKYHDDFDRMMDNGRSYMTVSKPKVSESELLEMYPRANAYLIALAESAKANYESAAAGQRALDRIINGEDYILAIEDMNKELSAITREHAWD